MTKKEFLELKLDTVISARFNEGVYFVIYDTDQMGTAYRGEEYRIYGAKQIDCDTHTVRIGLELSFQIPIGAISQAKPAICRKEESINNCQFWKIEGKMI